MMLVSSRQLDNVSLISHLSLKFQLPYGMGYTTPNTRSLSHNSQKTQNVSPTLPCILFQGPKYKSAAVICTKLVSKVSPLIREVSAHTMPKTAQILSAKNSSDTQSSIQNNIYVSQWPCPWVSKSCPHPRCWIHYSNSEEMSMLPRSHFIHQHWFANLNKMAPMKHGHFIRVKQQHLTFAGTVPPWNGKICGRNSKNYQN